MDAILILTVGLLVLIAVIVAVTHVLDRAARHRESGTALTVRQIQARLAAEGMRTAMVPTVSGWR